MGSPPDVERTPRCANCGTVLTGPWCAGCGQDAATGDRAWVRTLLRQWQRIRHSLWALVAHPGQLTKEFRDGQRARSVSPWRLTFNVVAVFFLLSFVTNFRVANLPRLDPSGTFAPIVRQASSAAGIDEATFGQRLDRPFNAIYTALVVVLVAVRALLARLTHWRKRERWGVHFVFALHLTAWTFFVNLVYFLALRCLNLTWFMTANDAFTRGAGTTLLALVVLWEFAYVLLAFRRVYADGWLSGAAKSLVMVGVGLLASNSLLALAFFIAIQTLST